MDKLKEKNGITLIALVITIIILLILAGITISVLGGENGLITRAKQAKQAQVESEMKQELTLALQDLQVERLGDATLDDVTQEWIDSKINNYTCTVKDDLSISGKKVIMEKSGIISKFLIDENLNITEIEEDGNGAILEYEALSRDGDNVNILITITDTESGLQQVEFPDGTIVYCNGQEQVAKYYEVQLGVEYKVKITSKDGQVKEETILISDYYHKITKNLGEGISIDNVAVKAAYNKQYQATITVGEEYIIETITVTMGGQAVTVDNTTGVINIEKVTGDIEITATARKLEIQITTPIIGTTTTATSSVTDNSQARETKLYINFSATLEGVACTVTPILPYEITSNGKYKFSATGTYNGIIITKEIEVVVNKYKSATGLVQYDAGDWTQEEIESLGTSYNINKTRTANSSLNFTFGGFTYKDDATNTDVVSSRNKSIYDYSSCYDGWIVLDTVEENGKTYVNKIIHAGCPETFVYYYTNADDEHRAEYILSGGTKKQEYNTLSDGTIINPRNWDMYRDEELDSKGYIKEVHCMTYDEANAMTSTERKIGYWYWLGTASSTKGYLFWVHQSSRRYLYSKSIYRYLLQ